MHHHTFVVTFLVRRNRANANGEIPIFVRLIVDGKAAEIKMERVHFNEADCLRM